MGFGVKLWFSFLFTLVIVSSARNTISVSGEEIVLAAEGRSLMASIEDYSEPTANRGHDPLSRTRSSSGINGGGRKGREG
ncbi:protein PSY3-like [Durio zibethinus]|uniref:Protein PSY3-like n=1 Tax=Durio zibethinus TaxID=66656 RepID=A0A6P5ZV33_DURZI|nr:protein PSY3-like [Durio zibethinus]